MEERGGGAGWRSGVEERGGGAGWRSGVEERGGVRFRDVNVSFFCERTFRVFLSHRNFCYFVSFSFLNSKKSKDSFNVY